MNNTESGFTLVEVMIATAMASIVSGIIYAAYNIQTKIYTEQDMTAEMQQNIRAGIYYLEREARVAGYNSQEAKDPSCNKPDTDSDTATPSAKKPGIHTIEFDAAETDAGKKLRKFGFSMDLNEDGDCADTGENVTYAIYQADGIWKLGRQVRENDGDLANSDPVAENVSNIDFVYLIRDSGDDDKKKQSRDPVADGFDLNDIVGVQVSLLAEARAKDRDEATSTTFTLPVPDWLSSGEVPVSAKAWTFNDSVRRRLLTTIINLRNMGL